jgi:uncharacterized protein YbjQ (UPF0145 family)
MQLVIFLVLLALGYGFGRWAEARHYHRIREREKALCRILVIPMRIPPPEYLKHSSTLVTGSVVISVDYFKTMAAALRNVFGGRVGAYESLLDRARREATIRMQEEAKKVGAQAVLNVKYETSRIGQQAGKSIGSVEVLAYGTAMIPRATL